MRIGGIFCHKISENGRNAKNCQGLRILGSTIRRKYLVIVRYRFIIRKGLVMLANRLTWAPSRTIAALGACLAIAGVLSVPGPTRSSNHSPLIQELLDRAYVTEASRGLGYVRFLAGGSAEFEFDRERTTGRWAAFGDRLCVRIDRPSKTERMCLQAEVLDGGIIALADGPVLRPIAQMRPTG